MSKLIDSVLLEAIKKDVEKTFLIPKRLLPPLDEEPQIEFTYLGAPLEVSNVHLHLKATTNMLYDASKLKAEFQQHWDREMLKLTQAVLDQDGILLDIPPEACDACSGRGVYNNEVCWHCEGEKVDPTK